MTAVKQSTIIDCRPSPSQQTQPPPQQTGAPHGRGQAYAAQPHLLSHRGGRGRGVGPIGRNMAMYARSRGKGRGRPTIQADPRLQIDEQSSCRGACGQVAALCLRTGVV